MMNTSSSRQKRNPNMELLRIVAILMVTMLHALGKGNLLGSLVQGATANTVAAWLLESLSISAVNIFMLVSGYFLIKAEFKLARLIELIAQIVFYTAGSFIVLRLLGIVPDAEMDMYWFLNYFLPVHMDVFWFMTAYLVIYALTPALTKGLAELEQKNFLRMIVILLIYECGFKSFLPFRMYADSRGYSFLWCLIVFLIGAYIRLYGFKFLNSSSKGWLLYFVSCTLIFAETFALEYANTVLGRLKEIGGASMDYNHIFVLTAALGIFAAFVNSKPMGDAVGKVVCFISPMTLGVYLLQENLTIRFRWTAWFRVNMAAGKSLPMFLLVVFGAAVGMFALGLVVDYIRIQVFKCVRRIPQLRNKKTEQN